MIKPNQAQPILQSNDVVRSYYYMTIDESNTGILVEDGCFEFMFIKEVGIKIKSGDNEIIDLPPYFGIGKVAIPYKLVFSNTISIFSVKLQPWVSGFFFKKNISGIFSLDDFEIVNFENLRKKIFSSVSFSEMIQQTEHHLINLNTPDKENYAVSKNICEAIQLSKGIIKVKDIVQKFPYSRQKLNRLFLHQTKSSIKEYAIYVKIRAVLDFKQQHKYKSLTEIAYDFEYFDQSHFIKDFKKVTGVKPSEFFKSQNSTSSQLKFPT